jgi:hypothetical protein
MTLAVDSGGDAVEWSSRQHFAYILATPVLPLPPPFPVPPVPGASIPSSPFRVMTDELQKIREANEKQLLHDAQQADTKKEMNGWSQLWYYVFRQPKMTWSPRLLAKPIQRF